MTTHAEQNSITKIRAQMNARKVSEVVREFTVKIRSAQKALNEARHRYELIGKEDVPALLQARYDVLTAMVRRQVLIECWETLTSQTWSSGISDE